MNLQQLYYFRTLSEVRHFTKAAAKLMVTQPSLSRAINDLEEELGVSLFNRNSRQVRLTKYGELLLAYVNQALDTLEEGRSRLRDLISPETGTIALYYVSSITNFIPFLVSKYLEKTQLTRLVFQFQNESNENIQAALRNGTADLGLGMVCGTADGLRTRCIGDHELSLVVPLNHPLAHRNSVDLRDVRGESFVTYMQNCSVRRLLDQIFQSLDMRPNIVLESVHDAMIYSAVAAGFGVALIPTPLGQPGYNLKVLPIENEIPKHQVYLMWRELKYMSPAVVRFRDFIIENNHLFDEFRAVSH